MQYRYLLAGALATSVAAFSNTTDTEPQTVTEIGSTIHTVITITSCEDNKCNEKTVPATHSIVTKTIDSVETVYTTLCPIETGKQPAPAPGPTGEQGQPPAEGEKTTEGQPPAPAPTGEQGQGKPPAPAAPENNNNKSQPPAPAPTGNASQGPAPHSSAPAPAAPAAPENNNNKSQPPAPAPTSAAEETKAPAPAPTGNASKGPAPLTTATTVAGPEKSAPIQQQQQTSAPGVPEVSGALEGAANANKLGFAMGAIGLIAALL
ncbi:hypothetical protein DIURU_004336 [Diutina rugosa]|uniref:Uncharacterized protein n=1 Tax=Diutina rugosa TaxID=5481 RepID=A0A642UHZ6_DIURU|nr:uncharacterized protein DIURU_004336 [Diutina rugosa]KAA8899314.1 hypothetical protein DIURU_004336 [Diutina rugosa]